MKALGMAAFKMSETALTAIKPRRSTLDKRKPFLAETDFESGLNQSRYNRRLSSNRGVLAGGVRSHE